MGCTSCLYACPWRQIVVFAVIFLLGVAFHELSEDKGFNISIVPKFFKPVHLVHGEMTEALTKPPSKLHHDAIATNTETPNGEAPTAGSLRGNSNNSTGDYGDDQLP